MTESDASAPVHAAIRSGDLGSLLDLLRALTPTQRHALRGGLLPLLKVVVEEHWKQGAPRLRPQVQAASAAVLLCGTAHDAVGTWLDSDQIVALCREFRPRALDGLADALLAHSPQHIRTVQALIAAGLTPRPDTAAYALGLIALPWLLRDPAKLQALMAADAGLAPALLRVFTVEGTADTSLASSDKYNHSPDMAWGSILLGLVERGVTTRAELLDRTLGALENDWPQFRSGWFSRFHAELAPSPAAMRPHLARYLALCHSRIPPTVSLALEALARLDAEAPLAGASLLDALRPVLAGAVKSQVEAALKLVDRIVQRKPAHSAAAAARVVPGLLLESAPLQKAILQRLKTWGLDDAARDALRGLGGSIAAVNRPAFEALLGNAASPPAVAVQATAVAAPVRIEALDPSRVLPPVTTVDSLVECIAHSFENDLDIDAFERALGGIVGLAPFSAEQQRSLSPVIKRAAKLKRPLAQALARLLLMVAQGRAPATQAEFDASRNDSSAEGLLRARIDDLIALARQGKGDLPLSTPTHQRGFIAPAALVARVAAQQAQGTRQALGEQVLALLRLAPTADEPTRAAARRLADEPFTRALRYALGDTLDPGRPSALFAAAARIRHAGQDDPLLLRLHGDQGPDAAIAARYTWQVDSREFTSDGQTYLNHDLRVATAPQPPDLPAALWAVQRHPPGGGGSEGYRWWSFGGADEAAVAWSATLLPSCLDAFWAEGARAVGNNLDWWEAQWQNAAYLRALLDPTATLGPMGTLLLALGLLGKEPGQTAIAVDALVQAQLDGRLNPAALGDTLRQLLCTAMPKAARLRSSLGKALQADAALRAPVFEALSVAVTADPPPREWATLLELLLELKLSLALPLPAAARSALASAKPGGRAKGLLQTLLA